MTLKSTKFIITICVSVQNVQKLVQQFQKKYQRKVNSSISGSFDGASDMTSVNNGVAERLRESQNLTHILNIHCICHGLELACADSSSQLTVLKDFEDVLIFL